MQYINTPLKKNSQQHFSHIIEQYQDNVSFLWLMRSKAVNQPHYNASDIKALESRIDAQLKGFVLNPDDAWLLCSEALALSQPGEVFSAAMVAFYSQDNDKINTVIKLALSEKPLENALISAMGWLPIDKIHPWIKTALQQNNASHLALALNACRVRRENPAAYLTQILQRDGCKKHIACYAAALRLMGELQRSDLIHHLNQALSHKNKDIQFWAIRSQILLGQTQHLQSLEPYVFNNNSHQQHALNLAFRSLPIAQAKSWINRLIKKPDSTRIAIQAIAALGDPQAIPWLIHHMEDHPQAKLAAEAFTQITGIELKSNNLLLSAEAHDYYQKKHQETEHEDDEYLLYPDKAKINALWTQVNAQYHMGQRYFLGKTNDNEHLKNTINQGMQRQRHAAALQLALNQSEQPFYQTKAKTV